MHHQHMMRPHMYRRPYGYRPFFFSPVFFMLMFVFFIGWKVFLFAPLIFFAFFMMKGNMMKGDNWFCDDDDKHGDPRKNDFRGYDDADDYYTEKPKGKPKRGNNDDYFDDEPMIL
jgi:hypothetical protein